MGFSDSFNKAIERKDNHQRELIRLTAHDPNAEKGPINPALNQASNALTELKKMISLKEKYGPAGSFN